VYKFIFKTQLQEVALFEQGKYLEKLIGVAAGRVTRKVKYG
jgi:hypothetical protein